MMHAMQLWAVQKQDTSLKIEIWIPADHYSEAFEFYCR